DPEQATAHLFDLCASADDQAHLLSAQGPQQVEQTVVGRERKRRLGEACPAVRRRLITHAEDLAAPAVADQQTLERIVDLAAAQGQGDLFTGQQALALDDADAVLVEGQAPDRQCSLCTHGRPPHDMDLCDRQDLSYASRPQYRLLATASARKGIHMYCNHAAANHLLWYAVDSIRPAS